ncbi:sodium:calcium antiporter, partial [[Eubacterium] siraeum]|nr:sodium:calcium antiporter [[Eubacterium] siraeum]
MLIAIIALVIGAALYVMNMVCVNINTNVICSLGVLTVGFAMLIKGADLFVEGASKSAAKFKIPQIVIGLTIVAMGTSAPEAAISISAAFQDAAA